MLRNLPVRSGADGINETKDCIEVLVVLEVLSAAALDLAVFGKYFCLNDTVEDGVVFEASIEDMLDITAFE